MTTIDMGERPTPYAAADSFGELEQHLKTALHRERSEGPPPLVRAVPPSDDRAVLRSIRALLLFIAFCAATATLLVGVLVSHVSKAQGGGALTTTAGPTAFQLVVPGPDPAADYFAHVAFADGTERDVQLGAYLAHTPLVRVEMAVTADPGAETSCRIVIDGVRVAQESATDGRTATCRWEAS